MRREKRIGGSACRQGKLEGKRKEKGKGLRVRRERERERVEGNEWRESVF
jgi:hypothetical protein